jgi:hypothetical protein
MTHWNLYVDKSIRFLNLQINPQIRGRRSWHSLALLNRRRSGRIACHLLSVSVRKLPNEQRSSHVESKHQLQSQLTATWWVSRTPVPSYMYQSPGKPQPWRVLAGARNNKSQRIGELPQEPDLGGTSKTRFPIPCKETNWRSDSDNQKTWPHGSPLYQSELFVKRLTNHCLFHGTA